MKMSFPLLSRNFFIDASRTQKNTCDTKTKPVFNDRPTLLSQKCDASFIAKINKQMTKKKKKKRQK